MVFEVLFLYGSAWNVPLLLFLIGVAFLYGYWLHRHTAIKAYSKQPILFLLSLSLFYMAIGSPFSAISPLSFSLHMIQMSVLYFIVPPIFMLGIPESIFKAIRKLPAIKGILKLFPPPKAALVAFAVLFFLYHVPVMLNMLSQFAFIQYIYLFLLFLLAFHMWTPITSPDSSRRLHKEQLKRYAFKSSLFIMPACLLFIVNALVNGMDNPFLTQRTAHLCIPYQTTSSFSLLPPPFNTKYDQMLAGVFMLGMHKTGIKLSLHLVRKHNR
ncbi:cytochrome c oxidase assembly protein [Virgibacillus sp. FSP13]